MPGRSVVVAPGPPLAGLCEPFADGLQLTGYGNGRIFHEVRRRIGRPELALIPIGAHVPRWFVGVQHTDPDEAVRILEDVGTNRPNSSSHPSRAEVC